MSEIKLKPCPFCGGSVVFCNWCDAGCTRIICWDCHGEVMFTETEGTMAEQRQEAAKLWNGRFKA